MPRSTRTPPNRSATVFAQYSANTLTLGTPANPLPVRTTSRFFPNVSMYRSSPHAFSNGTCVVVDLKCVAPSLSCVLANEYNHAPDGSITTARSARSLLSLDKTLKHARPLPTIASSHRSHAVAMAKTPAPSRRTPRNHLLRDRSRSRAPDRAFTRRLRAPPDAARFRARFSSRVRRRACEPRVALCRVASLFSSVSSSVFLSKKSTRRGCAIRPTRRRTTTRATTRNEPARERNKINRRVARCETTRARGWMRCRVESLDLGCAFSRPTRERRERRLTR